MKVYLSGGMKTGWQDKFRAVEGHTYFDPRDHGLTVPKEYVAWDLERVSECDLVIAYLEASNPSGIGLSVELGYAHAQGKEIFLVCEHKEKKWDFIRALADHEFETPEDMLEALKAKA
jgi:nucleoside 2-deoxyribosyltransferase